MLVADSHDRTTIDGLERGALARVDLAIDS
jgi:hypothetical protein